MALELATQQAAGNADNSPADEPEYASLLDESDGLDIADPNDQTEQDAADADPDAPDEGDDGKTDGRDAISVTDDATLKLDGKDVTVRELKETFTTFQRKTQEYAEADVQREVQARSAIAAVQEEAAQRVATIANSINDLVLPGVDMSVISRLRLEDPAKAGELLTNLQIVERWKNDMMAKANELWNQSQNQRTAADQKRMQAQNELLQSEGAKLADAKWFNDDFKIKAKSFLKSHGVPEAFASQIPYAGGMEIIRKAMAYDKAHADLKAGKQPSQSPQVPASGKAREATARQRAAQAFDAATKPSATKRDTARAYASLLGG
jgi:hypothetical protein